MNDELKQELLKRQSEALERSLKITDDIKEDRKELKAIGEKLEDIYHRIMEEKQEEKNNDIHSFFHNNKA